MFFFQMLGIFIPALSFMTIGSVRAVDGIMMAFMTFYIFYIGVDMEWNFILFVIPIRVRGRIMLLIFVIIELVFFALNIFSPFVVEYIGTLMGFPLGYIIYRFLREKMAYRSNHYYTDNY